MIDKQRYDTQRRRTPPIGPPITPQIQALPELQPLNQSARQKQSQMTQINRLNQRLNCNQNRAKLTMWGRIIN
ncbi:MAG: hypothetical protein EZS28_002510 [Streblomastix strix]|uniref:Uncharacterized protein n=1 Tax=Streblomastix strix TaxID=222440 RepID=A0A5J4X5B2_9EUKA|nr:MAG: hypothetical protein EZS28_002510 [Streblomastix strix]